MTRTQWIIIAVFAAGVVIVFCIGISLLVNLSAPRSTPITIAEVTTTSVSTSRLNPTNTPQPTPQPSYTPLPSSTPTLAVTPSRTLTPTRTATWTITPKPTITFIAIPKSGLGVTRAAIQVPSEKMGFSFESTVPAIGFPNQPRFVGTLDNNQALINNVILIGPPENLVDVTVTVALPYDDPNATLQRSTTLAAIVYLAAPSCKDILDKWFVTENIKKAMRSEELNTKCGKLTMTMYGFRASDGVQFTFTVSE